MTNSCSNLSVSCRPTDVAPCSSEMRTKALCQQGHLAGVSGINHDGRRLLPTTVSPAWLLHSYSLLQLATLQQPTARRNCIHRACSGAVLYVKETVLMFPSPFIIQFCIFNVPSRLKITRSQTTHGTSLHPSLQFLSWTPSPME